MNLIIIGKGNHIVKNILPAISRSRKIAVSGYIDKSNHYHCSLTGQVKSVDENFYLEHKDKYFYVATPIATHFLICKNLLQRGLNVICEKLLAIKESEAKELFSLSNGNLHEVCMYKYHKAYDFVVQYVSLNQANITKIEVDFKIPTLPLSDFRYNKELGGGAINDLGFYPISFLEALPFEKKYSNSSYNIDDELDIDTDGSLTFSLGSAKLVATWGIGKDYTNRIKITESDKIIVIDRFFSKPFDFEMKATYHDFTGNVSDKIVLGADDQFKNMIESIGLRELNKHDSNNSLNIISLIEKVRGNKF